LKGTRAFFFDGAAIVRSGPKVPPRIMEFVSSRQGMALSQAFVKISDRAVRRILVSLVERIARLEHYSPQNRFVLKFSIGKE
jgi:hypothetical protein